MTMIPSTPEFDSAIAAYYDQSDEADRLQQGAFALEALRTRELIERYGPAAPGAILDIGGASGAYAFWLAERGYSVHLVDPVPRHIDQAAQTDRERTNPLASCALGDARALGFADGVADAVLLLGPLYHLTGSEQRAQALSEAARVLKPGGVLFAAGISRYASTLDGLARELFADPRFASLVAQDLRDGQHRNTSDRLDYFTTAYFHRPQDLRSEVAGAGLSVLGIFGIEGPGWILPDITERLADPQRREHLLRAARMIEQEPDMIGSSAHLLAVARKNL
jgi:ubiquinone/menaquinone biosynthesis C-methylase UbiE